MESSLPMLFAAAVGFGHVFEADHLVAVGNIITKRKQVKMAVKDGVYWGLGHTSTILLIGLIMIIGKATFLDSYFSYFEAGVGLMLVILGIFRMYQYFIVKKKEINETEDEPRHDLAYGVGLIHGLAGSGAMILLVMRRLRVVLTVCSIC